MIYAVVFLLGMSASIGIMGLLSNKAYTEAELVETISYYEQELQRVKDK